MEFFDKSKGCETLKTKYDYIKNHFTYFTLNSWNRLKSIANNSKIYKLGLGDKEDKAYEILYANNCDNLCWLAINDIIDSSNLKVGFNGRQGGYLVLYNTNNNGSALKGDYDYDSYKDCVNAYFQEYACNYNEAQFDVRENIESDFKTVVEFDRLCDTIRDLVIYFVDNYDIEEVEEDVIVKQKYVNLVPKVA